MKHIYLFSGMGADHRVFQYLDFSGYNVTFIEWVPNKSGETVESYVQRLRSQVKTDNPILIGLSFGGIVAVEMAKFIRTEKIILIASVKTCREMPPFYRNRSLLKLRSLLPNWMLTRPNFIINWLFGTETRSDRRLLAGILHDTDPVFLKWALGTIITWDNMVVPNNVIHIHGTDDRLFPFKYVKDVIPVESGGHFMTVNKPGELNGLIRNGLS
jgi:pimeloyl-ACP methyl ester carboxylesterase